MAIGFNVIRLASGGWFNFDEPENNKVQIQDVAHGLAFICRYGAQCPRFYSVASHSVLVSQILYHMGESIHVQYEGLMHDATEAFMGDMVTPLKRLCPEYARIEGKVLVNLAETFGFNHEFHPSMDLADKTALAMEKWMFWPESEPWEILIKYGLETRDGGRNQKWSTLMEDPSIKRALVTGSYDEAGFFLEHYNKLRQEIDNGN